MASILTRPLMRWAGRLRFPRLAMITAGLFLADLVIPDFIPFVDEILLGFGTLLLTNLKQRRPTDATADAAWTGKSATRR